MVFVGTWVAWAVLAAVAGALGFTGYHFGLRTVRLAAAGVAAAFVIVATAYGLRHPVGQPADLAHAFVAGADGIAAALLAPLWPGHDLPAPGQAGWIAIGVAIVVGYRELEAWTLRWQVPLLDTSRLGDEPFAAEVRFRLSTVQVRSPSVLPGGSRTNMLAAIPESSGVVGGIAGAIIWFGGVAWPKPRRHRLQVWPEPDDGSGLARVTIELTDSGSGTAVATRTVAAASLSEAATMVAGYVARHVFDRDPATPQWCYGAADGHDLAVSQLARQARVDVAESGDMERSRRAQIAILGRVASAERCAGLMRYDLAQLYDLGGDTISALRLHAMNREQYPRFFRGRYRLAMSLEMIANPGFCFTDADAAVRTLDQALGSLWRCGLTEIWRCPPNGLVARGGDGRAPWVLAPALNAALLRAARTELLAIRRQLNVPAVAWAMFRRRDERATWRPHWRMSVRQVFRDGVNAGLLLVDVRRRLNGDPVDERSGRPGLRIADAVTGDSDPITAVLRQPSSQWRLTGGPPRLLTDRLRRLPWLRRTASWQAAYNVACLYSALVQRGLADENRIVASLRRAIGNRSSEMERPYDWIAHDPDFVPLLTGDPRRYPEFAKFVAEQRLLDYPDHGPPGSPEPAGPAQPGESRPAQPDEPRAARTDGPRALQPGRQARNRAAFERRAAMSSSRRELGEPGSSVLDNGVEFGVRRSGPGGWWHGPRRIRSGRRPGRARWR